MSAIECPVHRDFVMRVLLSFHPFFRKVSVVNMPASWDARFREVSLYLLCFKKNNYFKFKNKLLETLFGTKRYKNRINFPET